MSNTQNLNIPLVAANQAQKEVTVNSAISIIDAILNRGANSLGLNAPPGLPEDGDLYIIADSPTAQWQSASPNDIAYYLAGWNFLSPNEGMSMWVNDQDKNYIFDGTSWVTNTIDSLDDLSDVTVNLLSTNHVLQYDGMQFINRDKLSYLSGLGVNTNPDDNNKLSVNSDAILFNNNGQSCQIKINKNGQANTASHLFQTGFSGRAEFGLIGNDNFEVKVSSDGSSWHQSYVIENSSGNIDFKDNQIIKPELKDYSITTSYPIPNSGELTLNLENSNIFEVTLTENISTTNILNPPTSGRAGCFTLILKQDSNGNRTITWPPSVKWPTSSPPTLTTSAYAIDILNFTTIDGGNSWYGQINGMDMG